MVKLHILRTDEVELNADPKNREKHINFTKQNKKIFRKG